MIRKFGLLAGCMMLLAGCTSHFISDEQFRDKVSQDFASRSHIMEAAGIDLSGVGQGRKRERTRDGGKGFR